MAKRVARRGGSKAPYTKYRKTPYKYPVDLARKYPADYRKPRIVE